MPLPSVHSETRHAGPLTLTHPSTPAFCNGHPRVPHAHPSRRQNQLAALLSTGSGGFSRIRCALSSRSRRRRLCRAISIPSAWHRGGDSRLAREMVYGSSVCAAHEAGEMGKLKALQHGTAASSASGSDEGASRQIGHAATAGTSNSGVTSPRRARGATSATDTGTGRCSRGVCHQARVGQRGCPVRSSGKRGKKAPKGHGTTCV